MKTTARTIWFSSLGNLLLFVPRALAQTPTPVPKAPDLASLANALRFAALTLRATAYGLAVAVVIYAGILYLTAYGDESKPTQAKNLIKGVAIGLMFVILAEVLVLALLKGVSPDANAQKTAIESILK